MKQGTQSDHVGSSVPASYCLMDVSPYLSHSRTATAGVVQPGTGSEDVQCMPALCLCCLLIWGLRAAMNMPWIETCGGRPQNNKVGALAKGCSNYWATNSPLYCLSGPLTCAWLHLIYRSEQTSKYSVSIYGGKQNKKQHESTPALELMDSGQLISETHGK